MDLYYAGTALTDSPVVISYEILVIKRRQNGDENFAKWSNGGRFSITNYDLSPNNLLFSGLAGGGFPARGQTTQARDVAALQRPRSVMKWSSICN
jgi:hypothetical protein